MSKLKYLQVKNITDSSADIYFYGEIVGDEWEKWCDTDTCPEDVINVLKQTEGKSLNMYINSPGGSVFAGLAIYNMLKRKPEAKTCYIDGVAASIASVIAMAADKIIMPANSFLMIHKPATIAFGNANDFRTMANELDMIEESILGIYENKLKDKSHIETIKQLVDEESWLNAEKAQQFFDVTVIEENKAVAYLDRSLYKNFKSVPESILEPNNEDETENQLKLLNLQFELSQV